MLLGRRSLGFFSNMEIHSKSSSSQTATETMGHLLSAYGSGFYIGRKSTIFPVMS